MLNEDSEDLGTTPIPQTPPKSNSPDLQDIRIPKLESLAISEAKTIPATESIPPVPTDSKICSMTPPSESLDVVEKLFTKSKGMKRYIQSNIIWKVRKPVRILLKSLLLSRPTQGKKELEDGETDEDNTPCTIDQFATECSQTKSVANISAVEMTTTNASKGTDIFNN